MKVVKKSLVVGMTVTALLGLTACGGSKSKESKDGGVKIRLLTRMAGTSPQVKIYKDVIEQFEKDYPDAEVIDESQGDEGSYNNKLKTSRASGDLPNIFRVQGVANLGEYIDNNLVMNMDETLKADKEWADGFTEGALNYYQVPGYDGTYAIPMESGLIGMYYNEKLFKEAGINEFPETWSQFTDAIKKLNAKGIVPMSMGAKAAYKAGHLHNSIFYHWLGTEAAKDLGTGKLKWTDPDVVKTIEYVKELADLKAWDKNAAGIDDNVALTSFLDGETAMILTGPWDGDGFMDKEKTEYTDSIKLAKFPYFEEKPEFKNNDMQVVSPYMVNGKLEGKDKDYTIELLKRLTSKDVAKRYAEEANFIVPRTDMEIDKDKVSPLFLRNLELSGTSDHLAVDVFDYDKVQSMQDRTRNSLVGVLTGNSPEQAAKEIQAERDKNAK